MCRDGIFSGIITDINGRHLVTRNLLHLQFGLVKKRNEDIEVSESVSVGMSNNPYTSNPNDLSGSAIPIRALVFDKEPVTQVEYRMYKIQENTGEIVEQGVSIVTGLADIEGMWHTMTQVSLSHRSYPYLWEADASSLSEGGDYIIEVRAIGSSTQKDSIPTTFPEASVDGDDIICFIDTAAHGNFASDIMIALKRIILKL